MALGAVGLTGCTGACEGAGCASGYSAAVAGVLPSRPRRLSGTGSVLNRSLGVSGTLALGPTWDLALLEGALLVGSPLESAVRVFDLSEDSPLLAEGEVTTDAATGLLQLEDTTAGFGSALAPLGDVDGDGIADLAVGAAEDARSGLTRRDGAVYVLSGAGVALSGVVDVADLLLARLSGADDGGVFGTSVVGCPDLDGDGTAEILAAAPLDNLTWTDQPVDLAGSVTLIRGADLPRIGTSGELSDFGPTWTGAHVGARAGSALSCTHDLTGDGVADLVIGATFSDGPLGLSADTGALREASGQIFILDGAAAVASATPPAPLEAAADRTLIGPFSEGWLGWSVATGDLDGDGKAELAAGAPGVAAAAGLVAVWTGEQLQSRDTRFPLWRFTGAQEGDGLGRSVAMADLDGDGLDDLLMGAPRRNIEDRNETFDAGTLYIQLGGRGFDGWLPNATVSAADAALSSPRAYLRTGQLIRTGDYDGDGDADVALLHRYRP